MKKKIHPSAARSSPSVIHSVEVYLHNPTLRFLPAAPDNSHGDVWVERKHWSVR